MCGFYGWIGIQNPDKNFNCEVISQKIQHRGPDDFGLLIEKDFGLGFRRLSILDLSAAGHQPMSSKNNKSHLVFNGEIYNYDEIRSLLLKSDFPLKGHSDTEVLLNLLVSKGENTLPFLNGMFAFTFVNTEKREFIIARDRLGVKPLYYSVFNNTLIFASELPALLAFGIEKKIDTLALNRYLRFGHITPPFTIFKDIYKLEPGHYLKGSLDDPKNFKKTKWWDLVKEENSQKSESDWLANIDDLLMDATKIRLMADVPVGLFLSGGIDSTLVAHYATAQNRFEKPRAFSVKFKESGFNEFEIAKIVAADKKIELVPIEVNVKDLNNLPKVHENIGEPFGDSSIVNQFYLSSEARKHATVFLSGDGGDEAFAGYPEYIKTYNNTGLSTLLGFIGPLVYPAFKSLIKEDSNFKQQLSKLAIGSEYLGAGIRNNFQEPVLLKLLNKKYRLQENSITEQIFANWDESKGLPLVKRMQLFDYKNYLEPDVLVKVDRATMANSIESRSPFLDYRLVELGLKIPNHHNVNKVQGKLLLRKLAAKHLPKIVTDSPKKGFSLPFKKWINDDIRHQLIKLNEENGHDIWDAETFRYVVKLPFESYDIYTIFWRVWMFEIWYKEIFANKEVGELLPGT